MITKPINALWHIGGCALLAGMAACMAVMAAPASAASPAITTQQITDTLSAPWGMDWLAKQTETSTEAALVVSEKGGRIVSIAVPSGDIQELVNIKAALPTGQTLYVRGQGGLLDVAVHTDTDGARWLYITYAVQINGEHARTALARLPLRRAGDAWQVGALEVLFISEVGSRSGRHFGARIAFDGMGFLYASMGDRGERANGQNAGNTAAAIIRLHEDGRVPNNHSADNVAANLGGQGNEDWHPAVFAYGSRNAQGLIWLAEPQAGKTDAGMSAGFLLGHEHGPRGGDELNHYKSGANYGWPTVGFGREYISPFKVADREHRADITDALYVWDPSIAPSGLAYVPIDAPATLAPWQGALLLASLKFGQLIALQPKSTPWAAMLGDTAKNTAPAIAQTLLIDGQYGRLRDVAVGADGWIYLLTDTPQNAQLVRLQRAK